MKSLNRHSGVTSVLPVKNSKAQAVTFGIEIDDAGIIVVLSV